MSDNVEHPSHYNTGSVETIDGIRAALGNAFLDYCRGNVLKYVWRCRHKGKLLEDLRKAAKYLEWAIAEAENDATEPTKPEHVEGVWVEEADANASKIEPTEWIPKVGDKVRLRVPVLYPIRDSRNYEGRITEISQSGRFTIFFASEDQRIRGWVKPKDLHLVEAAQ